MALTAENYYDIFEAEQIEDASEIQDVVHRASRLLNLLVSDFRSIREATNEPEYEQLVLVTSATQEPSGSRGDWRTLGGWLCLVDDRADSWGGLAVSAFNCVSGVDSLRESIGIPIEIGQAIVEGREPFDRDPRRAICLLIAQMLDFYGFPRVSDETIFAGTAS